MYNLVEENMQENNQIYISDKNLKQCLLDGVNLLCNTVKVTLGAKGKTVIFNNNRDLATITKDGATVADKIHSRNPYEELAIKVVREASKNTMVSSGDGTTSTLVLSQAIINNMFNAINRDKSITYYEFAKQAEIALRDILEYINANAIHINGDSNFEYLRKVATVSANDPKIGNLINGILEVISVYGDLEVQEDMDSSGISIEVVKGLKLHKGYFSPSFCNNKGKDTFEASDVIILIYNDVIQDPKELMPAISYAGSNDKALLAFVTDIAPQALKRLEEMVSTSGANIMLVPHDGMGDNRIEIMNDLATLTNGYILSKSDDIGTLTRDQVKEYFGSCNKVVVTQMHTSIIEGHYNKEELDYRIDYLKEILQEDKLTPLQRKLSKKRLGALLGGMAVIFVGAQTDVERRELKDRIDDAVLAVDSAIKYGVVVGGAFTWINCYNTLKNKNRDMLGYQTVIHSLVSILDTLLINADIYYMKSDIIKQFTSKNKKAFDLVTNKYFPLEKYEIYDATSVLTDAITNAITVAKSILSIEAGIFDGIVLE